VTLNPHQLAAARSDGLVVTILAGAGTGKTKTLLARAVEEAGRADRVRLAAFTRAAAREMSERLDALDLPADDRRRIEVSTLHGQAHALLRDVGYRPGPGQGQVKDFGIVDELDDQSIERSAKEAKDRAESVRGRARLLRYGDLLTLATRELRGGRAPAWLGGSLLLDEAQDLTREEWEFAAALSPTRVTAVGDRAQAIYGWRGGLPDFVHHTHDFFGHLRQDPYGATGDFALPVNYRSLQGILDVANRLSLLRGRVDLQAHRGTGGTVEVWDAADDAAVASRLAETIGFDDPGTWAVLSRTKGRLGAVAFDLEAAGIPVHAPALAGQVWDSKPARNLVDALHCVVNPHDTLHLYRLMERVAGWTRLDMAQAEDGRARTAQSLWDWACANVAPDSSAAGLLRTLEGARRAGDSAAAIASALEAPPLVCAAVPPGLSPAEFLGWLADPNRDDGPAPEGKCFVGTVHGAKGREWQNVLVLGLEDGTLPLVRRDSTPETLEEERRLFYVAVTRAADRLALAWSEQRPAAWGSGTLKSQKSRFLGEVGL